MPRDLFGRRRPRELSTAEERLACFPVRSARDATLHGIEVRSWPADVDLERLSRRDCPPLDVDQLEWILSESLADRVTPLHQTHICIPVSVRALSRPWAMAWIGSRLKDRDQYASMLTFAFTQREARLDPDGLAACIEPLTECSARVALTEVDDLQAPLFGPRRARKHIDEVRLAVSCTGVPAALFAFTRRLRCEGTIITMLDLGTTQQAEIAIEAEVDVVQGDLIGRPFSLIRLEAVLLETLPGELHGDSGDDAGRPGRS